MDAPLLHPPAVNEVVAEEPRHSSCEVASSCDGPGEVGHVRARVPAAQKHDGYGNAREAHDRPADPPRTRSPPAAQ